MERAIRQLKNGKSERYDNIPAEVIKAMDNISSNALHHLINRIWNEEQIPDDWRKGLLSPRKAVKERKPISLQLLERYHTLVNAK